MHFYLFLIIIVQVSSKVEQMELSPLINSVNRDTPLGVVSE